MAKPRTNNINKILLSTIKIIVLDIFLPSRRPKKTYITEDTEPPKSIPKGISIKLKKKNTVATTKRQIVTIALIRLVL